MKIINLLKYIVRPASYGVMIAVVLLLLIPEWRTNTLQVLENSSAPQQALSYARAVSIASPSVVNIYSEEITSSPKYGTNARRPTRLGSGVIMDAAGYLLTNYHVVEDADLITVLLQNGQHFSAELIGFDNETDLAVLKVETTNLPVIPQRANLQSLAGDVVLAIGNPFNLGQTVTQGVISATGRSGLSVINYLELLQMDAAINEGNSGGALINTNGELVGINSKKYTSNNNNRIQGIFFAVPYTLAHKVMRKIIANGRVIRGYLGVTVHSLQDTIKGFTIGSVAEHSPAKKAGLKANDIVYQINEVTITSFTHALDIVADTLPGTTLSFKLLRDKQQLELPVTIVEKRNN
ncbi:MAG: trypsin-like peptidase domain-containing protein [Colwellia sp.]|nr:trypsin-like peptidase domain-containing protein [Colwellia sp.]